MSDRVSRFQPGNPPCFAPPIDAARLKEIEGLIPTTASAASTAMRRLHGIVAKFLETPKSARPPAKVQVAFKRDEKGDPIFSTVDSRPLENAEIERIWDDVPWLHAKAREEFGDFGDQDCDQYAAAMDPLQGKVRDAAWHLLWYVRELALDREPMTNDRI